MTNKQLNNILFIMISYQDKYNQIAQFIIYNSQFQNDEIINELNYCMELITNLEPLEIPTNAKKAIAHALRFDLDFGGNSKTVVKLDVLAKELASEGFITESESTADLEDALISLYNQNKNIENQIQESKDKLNYFYNTFVLTDKIKFTKKQNQNIFYTIYKVVLKSFIFVFKNYTEAIIKLNNVTIKNINCNIIHRLYQVDLHVLTLFNTNSPPSNKNP